MELSKLVPELLHEFSFARIRREPGSPHMHPPRHRDGKRHESDGGLAPWFCSNSWFLETKVSAPRCGTSSIATLTCFTKQDLWLQVSERNLKEG